MSKILVVEDEEKIARVVLEYLEDAGYEAIWHSEGEQAAQVALDMAADLVVLDLMLPGKDGLEVCREIKQIRDLPIVMVTARVEEIDRLLGLELGADDYVCKPFSPRELIVRIKNILRRVNNQPVGDGNRYGGISVDRERFEASLEDIVLDLTPVEFRILSGLLEKPGRVLSRENLMQIAYTDGRYVSGRTIDTHIKNLRAKLKSAGELIRSVYGVGYKLE